MPIRFIRLTPTGPSPAILCELTDRNLNILAHAQSIELDIGSRCGGHGVCGGDRVRIKGRPYLLVLNRVTEEEKTHLSAKELADGWRLACQCFPETSGESLEIEFLG